MRTASIFTFLALAAAGAIRAQPAVTLEAVTGRQYYREVSDNEIYVEARIAATRPSPAFAASVRNIVLVLDRSGSMAGEAIEAERRAAIKAIDALADGDFVAVIVFGSEVETLIEAEHKGMIHDLPARIGQIEPAGGAALYDALNQAAAQLRRNATPTSINQIILVTDGPSTKGPREPEDFARLAAVFAREGVMLSTIGLGPDFEEDTLAAMARTAHGRFRYAPQAGGLATMLVAEIAPASTVVGYDAVLAIEFNRLDRKVQARSWRAPVINERTLTWNFPRLSSDQPLHALASAEVDSFHSRFELADFATVRLSWKSADNGRLQEISRVVPVRFSRDILDIRESLDIGVTRAGAAVVIRDGLQHAIEQIDKGDPRRALRILRSARSEARDLNFDRDDAEIDQMVRRLDAYLAEAQGRVMGPMDRKILRSGLSNQFEPPAEIPEPKN